MLRKAKFTLSHARFTVIFFVFAIFIITYGHRPRSSYAFSTLQETTPTVSIYLPIVSNDITGTPVPTATMPITFEVDGIWRGTTVDSGIISFEITDHKIMSLTESYQIGGCGATISSYSPNGLANIYGNFFGIGLPIINGPLIFVEGRFHSDICATGTLKVTGTQCGSLNTTWIALKQGNESASCTPPPTPIPPSPTPGTPTPTPGSNDTGKVVFVSNRDENSEIYTMNANGSSQTRLTANTSTDTAPEWSPDGSQIVFQSYRDGNGEIYLMNADGSGQTRLTTNSTHDYDPTWSSDGTLIAFESNPTNSLAQIYIINVDGSGYTKLTSGNTSIRPDWSPDGTQVAFVKYTGRNWDVHVINVDGSGEINLSNTSIDEFSVAWSPDGTQLLFSSCQTSPFSGCISNMQIYIMNQDGSNQQSLTSNGSNSSPRWSPDGKRIIFTSNRDGNYELYVMNADGTDQTRLTDNPTYDTSPDWTQ